MKLKPFLRPSGSVTPTKHLRPKCDSHFGPRRLGGLTWCYKLSEGIVDNG
jgi:hypothetical protein